MARKDNRQVIEQNIELIPGLREDLTSRKASVTTTNISPPPNHFTPNAA